MSSEAPRKASYADVLAAPANMVTEVLGGTLYTQPRPALRHARATSVLLGELEPGFGRGRGGPGGWTILVEPELHLGSDPDIVVPDLAGWRLTTLPELPDAAYLAVAPDWVCEILSPSTRRMDRVLKMALYRREAVTHVWLVDPEAKTLEVFRLDGETYRVLETHAENASVHAEPFEASELHLGAMWLK